jgi:hypothetical protein
LLSSKIWFWFYWTSTIGKPWTKKERTSMSKRIVRLFNHGDGTRTSLHIVKAWEKKWLAQKLTNEWRDLPVYRRLTQNSMTLAPTKMKDSTLKMFTPNWLFSARWPLVNLPGYCRKYRNMYESSLIIFQWILLWFKMEALLKWKKNFICELYVTQNYYNHKVFSFQKGYVVLAKVH